MVYTFLHLDNPDARIRDCREWSIPGMGYINVDRNWWFSHYSKTPRQVYDDSRAAGVSIETTIEYTDMLPCIMHHPNFWKYFNNHEFIIPEIGYIYVNCKRFEYTPLTTYWCEAFNDKTPLEIYYTEGKNVLQAKIAIFNQAVHAIRAISYRFYYGYFPRKAVKLYFPEAIDLAVKLIKYKFSHGINFTENDKQVYAPILPQVIDELWVIIIKHKGYLSELGEVEPADVTINTKLPDNRLVAIRADDDIGKEEEEEEIDRGIINEVVLSHVPCRPYHHHSPPPPRQPTILPEQLTTVLPPAKQLLSQQAAAAAAAVAAKLPPHYQLHH